MYPNSYKADRLRYLCDLKTRSIKSVLLNKDGLIYVYSNKIISKQTICSKLIKVMYA